MTNNQQTINETRDGYMANSQALEGLLNDIRENARDTTEQGDGFEKLVKFYLENDAMYKAKFEKVTMGKKWRDERKESTKDLGIDLVAEEYEEAGGRVYAIQAKFYKKGTPVSKKDIGTFFTESGKTAFTNRMFISATNDWGDNAEQSIKDQNTPCTLVGLSELERSDIIWGNYNKPEARKTQPLKTIRPSQQTAIDKVCKGLREAERGKLIMACGTGKTLTSLKIAEELVPNGGNILFLVPSLSLLSQTLREWSRESNSQLRSFIVCSDSQVGKDEEDISLEDLPFYPTTNSDKLASYFKQNPIDTKRRTVIFSTYHSIDVISKAQRKGLPDFGLIICDEAHRTAGSGKKNKEGELEKSHFIKVHDKDYIRADKRLYMTATPKIYSPQVKTKASNEEVPIYSMDDAQIYGKQLHCLGFGEAVENELLADYKVVILGVEETAELVEGADISTATKIIGCWRGLSKKFKNPDETLLNADEVLLGTDEKEPMRRAVAFTSRIIDSENLAGCEQRGIKKAKEGMFNAVIDENITDRNRLMCETKHVDGTMNSLVRNERLDWLRKGEEGKCCILFNARCLSEGVDVPALDAVMFMNPRKAQVDIVQSVGRVMRKIAGKKYGYVILPVVIKPGKTINETLSEDSSAYKTVWQVLQALRAHDDRFNVIINTLELNKTPPPNIIVDVAIGKDFGDGGGDNEEIAKQFELDLKQNFTKEIHALIVKHCGERQYWEKWAEDVADIVQANIEEIKKLLEADDAPRVKFDKFLTKLQKMLNPNISEDNAIEMLSQHLITKPVFDALFGGSQFTDKNPVSKTMKSMLKVLDQQKRLESRISELEGFYETVKKRVKNIDNSDGRQKILLELYDNFFSIGFKKESEKLGIVYTPVEVVDFILASTDAALKNEFGGKGLTSENVHILDPFTGTGTFMARLLREGSPFIEDKDLTRKYQKELHANEIILLAYYIAAVNIEEVYHGRSKQPYETFNGIVLTDTFQLGEMEGSLSDEMFEENSERAKKQKNTKIRVIIGNPPYSAKQKSANDDNPNEKYEILDKNIKDTYIVDSSAKLRNSLYDSYIRSLRWATNRIGDEGIVAFVTNGSFIDGNAASGVRKHLLQDFSAVYCFNLRGDARTQGELRRMEKGNVFGVGTRTPVAITLFIKKKNHKENGKLYYHAIGDYLTQKEKLDKIQNYQNYRNIDWQEIVPNEQHDWINQRDPKFTTYLAMGDKENKKKSGSVESIFTSYSGGVKSNRDSWVYGYSKQLLSARMEGMVDYYNQSVDTYINRNNKQLNVKESVSYDSKKISWDGTLLQSAEEGKKGEYEANKIRLALYRPFTKQWLYFDRQFNNSLYRIPKFFPTGNTKNLIISVPGKGGKKEFSSLMTNITPDLNLNDAGSQLFPLYTYDNDNGKLLKGNNGRQDNIPDATLKLFQQQYKDTSINKEDIFYYVYGIFHAPEYKSRFEGDLKKMLPHIPYVEKKSTFWQFSKAGRMLGDLHINYEDMPEYPVQEIYTDLLKEHLDYTVKKMKFAGGVGDKADKSVIKYNEHIRLEGIPLSAYDYQLNGKSAIEWIIDRYQINTDKDSGIVKDQNDWSKDEKYILKLLKKVIHVSVESVKIINALPPLDIKDQ